MYKIGLEYETIGIVKSIDKCEWMGQPSYGGFCENECTGQVNGDCGYSRSKTFYKKLDPTGIKLHLVDKMEKKYHEQTCTIQDTFKIYLENIRKNINYEWINGYNADYIKEYRSILGPELLLQVMAEVEYRLEHKVCPICKHELEVPTNPTEYHPNHICECGRLKKDKDRIKHVAPAGFYFSGNDTKNTILASLSDDSFITREAYNMNGIPRANMYAVYNRRK